MKRIIYTFFMGMLCALNSMGQPFDVVLNTAQQGTVTNQARNSITMAAGYSYTPSGGTMLAQIVNPVVIGSTSYATAIIPSSYAINTSLAVGKTTGELNVSGMANYTVPLDAPKGTAGLQPNLSLNYISSFTDGLMGIGWNIGRLSSISRVGQNLYFETQSNPVKGDLTDRYALDGKRMVVTNNLADGADGSEYDTEIAGFSKIIAHGASGSGPTYFEVKTKSGLIFEYGNTADSKVLRDGTCVLTWKVNKITDRYGNYISFSYFESDDERPILKIQYAGATSTLAEINFRYKQRSDISAYVYGGKEFTCDLLLDNIEMKNNAQAYKKYELAYCLVDNRAQLQKVTEYSSQNQPLNPLVFTYTDQTEQISYPTLYSSSVKERFYHGDFNGDGRMDVITIPSKTTYVWADKWKLYLSNASGTLVYQTEGNLTDDLTNLLVADFNGDGLTDMMMVARTSEYQFRYYQSSGSNLVWCNDYWSVSLDKYDYANHSIIDYNGDGKLEVFVYDTKHYQLYTYSGTKICEGTVAENILPIGDRDKKVSEIYDLNGDDCSDVLTLANNKYVTYEFKGVNNKLSEQYRDANYSTGDNLHLGDMNGDGITDIVKQSGFTSPVWSVANFTKDGFKERIIYGISGFDLTETNNKWITCDVNADGKSDIVIWGKGTSTSNSANRVNVAINKGNGYEYSLTEYTSPVTFDMAIDADYTNYFNFGDYNGDGRDEFFYSKPGTGSQRCFSFATGTPSNLLSYVIDGFGAKTQITYKPMSDINVYARGTGATYPLYDFSSGTQLVRQVDSDDGIGGSFTTTYRYDGAKIHLKGKGFLGFTKTTRTNVDNSIFTENNFEFVSPYYYPKLLTSYTRQGSTTSYTPVSTLVNTWDQSTYNESNRIFPYIKSSTQTDNLKGLSVTSSVVYPTSNLYGNPTSATKSYSSGPTETTSFLYDNELTGNWLIGRPTTITKTSTNGSDTQTYVTTRTYLQTSNDPDIDQNNPGDASWWLLNRGYDTFGNLEVGYNTTSGLTDTHTSYLYDSNGVNLLSKTERDGTVNSMTYYPATNLLNTQTDPYGNVVTYSYNSSDQLSTITPSTGIATTITSSFNVSGGPTNTRYYVNKTGNDGSQTKVWYDNLGRELRTETRKFGGTLVKGDKQYNGKGELAQYSEPTTGTPSSWNTVGHDTYGRVNSLDPIFGPTTTYSEPYGNTTTTRTVNGRNYKTTINAAGWITSTEDPGGAIINTYWPNGLLKSTLAPGSVTTSMAYDKNGNRLAITDPSAGNIANTWYGTGQPKTTANAVGQTTTYTYQADGLLDYYTASPADEGQTNYTYNDKKLVSGITSPGGVSRSYTYELGKVKTITEAIDGVSNLVTFEYDTKGRLFKKYFNGTSEYEQYDYDTNSGYLYRIQFTAAGTTSTVWLLTTMDQYQRITQATIGSVSSAWTYDSGKNTLSGIAASGVQGYTYSFDANTGNLLTRTNSLKSKTETFGYDTENLDRLTSVTGPVNSSATYTTDKNGNILTKGDAGTYVYDATQPYAVDQITGGLNISNDQQDLQYYSFGKVKKITEGTGVTQKTADFAYNADYQRIRMVLKTNGTATKTRYYFGGSCEREVVGTTTTQYIWIGGDAYSAVAVAKKVGSGSWTVYNIFRDHLGTITHLKTGTSTADEYSFDAWGRSRDKDDWTYTLTSEPALFADRGFTGHEYLEDFKLYNMNGRLYDPVVGRFLNADPVVQDPTSTQSMNRYSYCLNNPLKYTDPSGEKWKWPKFERSYLIPVIGQLDYVMQTINDNTEGVRQKMADAGIPDFQVGMNANLDGNVNFNASYRGQEVLNTENIDRSNAEQVVNKELTQVRQDYGDAWREASLSGGNLLSESYNSILGRIIVPDFLAIGVGFNGIAGFGGGSSLELRWITHGPEASWKPMVTVTQSLGGGFSVDVTLNIEAANYIGNVNNIRRRMMQTNTFTGDFPTIWGSAGVAAGGKIGVTGYITPNVGGSVIIGRELNIGAGLPAGPFPVNGAGGTSNTWILHDFY